jgi:hypothetical protein
VLGLLEGKSPGAFFSYRSISQPARDLFHRIYVLFASPTFAITREYGMVEAHGVMKTWWEALPQLALIPDLYAQDENPFISDFLLSMKKIETKDAYAFLLTELPLVFALDASLLTEATVEQIIGHLTQIKHSLESAETIVQERILKRISDLFGLSPSSSYQDMKEEIQTWYRRLDLAQQDPHAPWYKKNAQARIFLLAIKSLEKLQETFFVQLPTEFGFQPVHSWSVDRSNEYLDRLQEAKATIDAHRIKVTPVQIEYLGEEHRQGNGIVFFTETIGLTFHHPMPGVRIYVAENGADPTDANADRKLMNGKERLEIREDTTLCVAALDAEGNRSQTETVRLMRQPKSDVRQQAARIASSGPQPRKLVTEISSTDVESILATCRSLLHSILERHLLTKEQLLTRVRRFINEL